MKLKYIITIGLSSLLLSAVSNAEEGKGKGEKGEKKAKRTFEAVDTNKDGKVSLEEFTTGAKDAEKAKERFGKKDKDSDGFLSKEEYAKGKKGKKGPKKPKEENA